MLSRVLEPEVMDTAEEAADYDSMDHSEVNRRFVNDWSGACQEWGLDPASRQKMLDVGTGTALIPIAFCERFPSLRIEAIDLAEEMLKLGADHLRRSGLSDRIELNLIDAKRISGDDNVFQTVISNSIMHHIPEPLNCFTEMLRVLAPGGLLFVRDLMRPGTDSEVESIVWTHAAEATFRQQQLFRQSLHAALTVEEVAGLLERIGLPRESVRATSDRHWTVSCLKTTSGY